MHGILANPTTGQDSCFPLNAKFRHGMAHVAAEVVRIHAEYTANVRILMNPATKHSFPRMVSPRSQRPALVSTLRRDADQLTRVAQSGPIRARIACVLLLSIGTVP